MYYTAPSEAKRVLVEFGRGEAGTIGERLRGLVADKVIVITDSNVDDKHGKKFSDFLSGLPHRLFVFPAGENNKTLGTYETLCSEILDWGITKKSVVVALGGGVVGNIAGFVAATLFRGIRFVQVPTTVMAQADASTGGKQAVNTRHGKNTLGTFYDPEFIIIDPDYLHTLNGRELRSGIAECIKHAFCQQPELLNIIGTETNDISTLSQILEHTVRLKCQIINEDWEERNIGKMMLYGHTVGHAIEMLALENGEFLTHGEAISIGMCVAARISEKMGFTEQDSGLLAEHEMILEKWNLPTRMPRSISAEAVVGRLKYDKKFADSGIEFVLLKRFGEAVRSSSGSWSVPVSLEVLTEALNESY